MSEKSLKFLGSESELLNFLLSNINRGSSVEELVKKLNDLLEKIFNARGASQQLCVLTLETVFDMIQRVCLRSIEGVLLLIAQRASDNYVAQLARSARSA